MEQFEIRERDYPVREFSGGPFRRGKRVVCQVDTLLLTENSGYWIVVILVTTSSDSICTIEHEIMAVIAGPSRDLSKLVCESDLCTCASVDPRFMLFCQLFRTDRIQKHSLC